jgi:hypothetical protein
LTRVSINLRKSLAKKMGCRVKPGNDGSSPRQIGRAHQERVDRPRAEAAFADRPDDERLAWRISPAARTSSREV